MQAAIQIQQAGTPPTVSQVADAAGISRATAYRYFPSQDRLLIEARLETMDPTLAAAIMAESADGNPDEPIAIVVGNLKRVLAFEETFRDLLRLSLSPSPHGGPEMRRLASRRVPLLEAALADFRIQSGQRTYRRLLGGLALCGGPEAMVVLRDLCGLGPEEAVDTARWAASVLLEAAQRDARPLRNRGSTTSRR
ncbi:MAG: TetR/AcrR family transcriptional regulator [Candidatus Dormibacteraceae bacterium]